jgi:hypothetical protein
MLHVSGDTTTGLRIVGLVDSPVMELCVFFVQCGHFCLNPASPRACCLCNPQQKKRCAVCVQSEIYASSWGA